MRHLSSSRTENYASCHGYSKNILKKVIYNAEVNGEEVLEDLYETYAHSISPEQESFSPKNQAKNLKRISFFSDTGLLKFVLPIQCSSNLLEGDTGCSIWPSSLFLSEFILSFPEIFCDKVCLELGAGVGLVGIILEKTKASKVVLTDGDFSTLENMRTNLEANCYQPTPKVECKYLLWESASEAEIMSYSPDIVVGADIVYDPLCLPHLVRVLSLLLKPNPHRAGRTHHSQSQEGAQDSKGLKESPIKSENPIAYLAIVIRNQGTFESFLQQASKAGLVTVDLTTEMQPLHFLQYMSSYVRAEVKLYVISYPPK
ncbi:uncharacterized protein LOC144715832 isoform X2 [Wolffia australiana]